MTTVGESLRQILGQKSTALETACHGQQYVHKEKVHGSQDWARQTLEQGSSARKMEQPEEGNVDHREEGRDKQEVTGIALPMILSLGDGW